MSPREQKLLGLFGVAGFIVLNFLGINYYRTCNDDLQRRKEEAKRALATAELFRTSRQQVVDQMEWLSKHEPKPVAKQEVQVSLEAFCKQQAEQSGLTIVKTQLVSDDGAAGNHFQRAKIQMVVQGGEQALYLWFDRINVPETFRAATRMVISPSSKDDTRVDCTATIEQWFVPLPPSA